MPLRTRLDACRAKPNYRRKYTNPAEENRCSGWRVAAPGCICPYWIAQRSTGPWCGPRRNNWLFVMPEQINPETAAIFSNPKKASEMILTVHVVGVAAHHRFQFNRRNRGVSYQSIPVKWCSDMPEAERLGIAVDILERAGTVHVFRWQRWISCRWSAGSPWIKPSCWWWNRRCLIYKQVPPVSGYAIQYHWKRHLSKLASLPKNTFDPLHSWGWRWDVIEPSDILRFEFSVYNAGQAGNSHRSTGWRPLLASKNCAGIPSTGVIRREDFPVVFEDGKISGIIQLAPVS